MRTTYRSRGSRASSDALIDAMAAAGTGAVTEVVEGFRDEMRDQVAAAGLGPRLANTWRGKVYPEGRTSANAAGIVYVNPGRGRQGSAPRIMDFFSSAEIVTPLAGRFLAIPTEHVPKERSGRSMSVAEVEARFGRDLVFISPGDKGFRTPSIRRNGVAFLVLKGLTMSRSGRYRNMSQRERTRGRRQSADVIMFILVPAVRGKDVLSPDQVYRRWLSRFPGLLDSHFELHAGDQR